METRSSRTLALFLPPSSSATQSLVVDPAVADGNCPFRAFALGLCAEEVLKGIIKRPSADVDLQKFIAAIIPLKVLKLQPGASWSQVAAALIDLKKSDMKTKNDQLQDLLHPILRALAVELMASHSDKYKAGRREVFLAASREFVLKKLKIGNRNINAEDDIFQTLPVMSEQFKKSYDSGIFIV